MNARYLVTASLLPLAALAVTLAPVLKGVATRPEKQLEPIPQIEPAQAPQQAPEQPPQAKAASSGEVTLSASLDRTVVYAGDRTLRVRVDLAAEGDGSSMPSDLLVVVDRSGSMAGEKMLDAKAAATELAGMLGPNDRLGIVSFGSDARIDWPLLPMNPGVYTVIAGLEEGGGTNMLAGLGLASQSIAPEQGRSARIVLISDGRPGDERGLDGLAAESARQEIPLSTVGIGLDYNEILMQRLADQGTGNFHWTQRGPELSSVLSRELATARATVARSLSLSLRGGRGAQIIEAGGLPYGEGGVPMGALFDGQRRTLWLTLQISPERGESELSLGELCAEYKTPEGLARQVTVDLGSVRLTSDARLAHASLGDAWASGVVGEEYNALRSAVSSAVQRGDQASALAAIGDYELRNGTLNEAAHNPIVDDNLSEVQQLKREVQQQFVGANQAQRQNVWAKGTSKSSYDGRRSGQIMPAPAPR